MLGEGGFDPAAYEGSLRDDAKQQAAALAGRAEKPGVAITTTVVIGSPFHDICTIAEQSKSDLIVVGLARPHRVKPRAARECGRAGGPACAVPGAGGGQNRPGVRARGGCSARY